MQAISAVGEKINILLLDPIFSYDLLINFNRRDAEDAENIR